MKYKIDVIIPSLGGPKLLKTIKSLNKGSCKPKKIICVVYNKKKNNFKQKFKNTKIYFTSKKGQILQRHIAFKKTSEKYILQLDDDVTLKKDCLEKLVVNLNKIGRKNVVGPIYKDQYGKPMHKIIRNKFQLLYDLYHYLICNSKFGNKKSGSLTPIFLAYGVDASCNNIKKINNTDWLPGGCVLGYRSEFIQKPKYPFKGKAYCEDIFYSILRKKKKIKHNVVFDAKVRTFKSETDIKSFLSEAKVRYFLINKFNRDKKLRFFIWLMLEFFKKIFFQLVK